VVIPDHRAPVVTHMIWYKVGAADEAPGKSGLAHFLEHLMFKGTAKYLAGKYSRAVERIDGQENAFTAQDYTAYFQRLPSYQLADEARSLLPSRAIDRCSAMTRNSVPISINARHWMIRSIGVATLKKRALSRNSCLIPNRNARCFASLPIMSGWRSMPNCGRQRNRQRSHLRDESAVDGPGPAGAARARGACCLRLRSRVGAR
jgi:Insulinase (Peptidase family M16)